MSRRYVSPDQISIDREFDLPRTAANFSTNFNAAPSQQIPVIRVIEGQPDPVLLTWGFGEHDTANLPVESLKSGTDRVGLLAQGQRCVIPALGFYEWQLAANGSTKPYYVHVEDQDIFGFAGFWERESCTLITMPANPLLAQINNIALRMPAILAREMREVWLYGSVAAAAGALAAYPDARLIAYAVSRRIDFLENNDETLIEPLQTDVD